MTEKRAYKRYPKECKEEVVALREQGYRLGSRSPWYSTTVLYKWKEKLEA